MTRSPERLPPFGFPWPTGRRSLWLVLIAGLLAAAACSAPVLEAPFGEGAAATPTARVDLPTLAPEPNLLVICLAEEPDSFYPFGPRNGSAQALLPLLYDGPIDVLGYQFSPVLLERIPTVETGDVRFEPVSLVSGDLYFNPDSGLPEEFRPNKSYFPSGCTSMDCRRRYEGGGATLDRLVVEFHLRPDLLWSDGEPLTAEDSVFAFQTDADPATPSLKDQVNRTSQYEAIDPLTVRWTGIPGFVDAEFGGNFWSPLPAHVLQEIPPGELPESDSALRAPIGWGPYQLDSWEPGRAMDFSPNPNYHGWGQGAPGYEGVHVRFLQERGDGAIQQLLTGECDVLAESLVGFESIPTLRSLADQGRLRWSSTPGPVIERIDFDTDPVDDRPGFFVDVEVRRAVAGCLNRSAAIDQSLGGLSLLPAAYLPAEHPLVSADVSGSAYDPGAAVAQLEAAGWIDDDGDPATPRRSQGTRDVPAGTPFEISLLTADDPFHASLAGSLANDLAQCGIGARVAQLPPEALYATWPDGVVFGRAFDLVLWPWIQWISPSCDVFSTAEIPSTLNPQGSNATGFSNAGYDAACQEASLGPLGGPDYRPSLDQVEAILVQAVPTIPILQWPRVLAFGPDICGPDLDPTVASLFWNVETWFRADACTG